MRTGVPEARLIPSTPVYTGVRNRMSSKPIYEGRSTINTREKVSLLATTGVVLGIMFLALASFPTVSAGQQASSNVQVYIQTSGALKFDTYLVTAYNSTGFAVASAQSIYPAASFELPNGAYIFTASANSIVAVSSRCVPTPVAVGAAAASSSSGSSPPSANSLPSKAMPINCGYPVSEYGYSEQQISASTVVNVTTQNLTSIATSTVTVKVTFANGTAASGASVSAYVLGGSYWYMPTTANDQGMMWETTDSTGSASLTVPAAPIQVSAWLSVPVDIPTSQTTVTRTIGGEKVNVTVYWQPTAISLAGTAVIVPPQTSASITLHYVQQPNYWVAGGKTGYASGSTGGISDRGAPQPTSSQPVATPQQQEQQTTAHVSDPSGLTLQTTSTQPATSGVSTGVLLTLVGIAVTASVASLGLVLIRSRSHA